MAGPDQAVRVGDTVLLDGTASHDDNTTSDMLNYSWSFVSTPPGSTANLTDADTDSPSFAVDVPGTYVVGLVVTDEDGFSSGTDEVEISSDNLAPTANAGEDQLVIVGNFVSLDGSGSADPENDALSYLWTIDSAPVGSTPTLFIDTDVAPIFTPEFEGVYSISLEVSDVIGPGAPDQVLITATSAEGYAEVQIIEVAGLVSDLDSALGEVTNGGNQTAYQNFLQQAVVAIQEDDIETAIDKLEKALARTDGCVLRGAVDENGPGRDWIADCGVQAEVYALLTEALAALQ